VTPAEAIAIPLAEEPRVSVIIPSAAGSRLLLACLRSLSQHAAAAIPFETIVVLNQADSDSVRLLEQVRGIRLEPSPVNLGLAGAGNRGRELARGELLILLHDDAEVEGGWMEALVAAADAHPEAGAIGGKVLNMDGTLQNAGLVLWRDGFTTAPWAGTPVDHRLPPPVDRLRAVDYCGTSSLLVRAAAWDAAGGLDEDLYPVYYVDVDLSMRLRALGRVVLYEPAAVIRHHRGGSGDQRWRHFVSSRNRRRFADRWRQELEQHQPRAKTSAAITRALARAEAFHASVIESRPPLPLRAPRLLQRQEHDLAHLQRDLELQKAYVRFLAMELGTFELPWTRLFARLRAVVRLVKRLAGR